MALSAALLVTSFMLVSSPPVRSSCSVSLKNLIHTALALVDKIKLCVCIAPVSSSIVKGVLISSRVLRLKAARCGVLCVGSL